MIPTLRARLRRHAKSLAPNERAEAERFAGALLQSAEAFCDHLLALLRDSNAAHGLRSSACWLLSVLEDRRAIPVLLKITRDRQLDWVLRIEAVQAIGRFRSKRGVLPLIEVLLSQDEHEMVRKLAAHALGWLHDSRARDALLRVVKNPDEPPGVRGDAAEALTVVRDVRSVPTLLEQLHDSSSEVRFWAVFALGQLAEPDVLPALERIAAEDEAVVTGWWSVRKEARDAIRSIQGRAATSEPDG